MSYQEVMLIRCSPEQAGARAVLAAVAESVAAERLLFFHGPGVAWATAESEVLMQRVGQGGTSLLLCSAGWRRRHEQAPPPGWRLGSLVQFWDAADRAERLVSFGALR